MDRLPWLIRTFEKSCLFFLGYYKPQGAEKLKEVIEKLNL
jgi:hypothetical protein